jgi:hypothetical protein
MTELNYTALVEEGIKLYKLGKFNDAWRVLFIAAEAMGEDHPDELDVLRLAYRACKKAEEEEAGVASLEDMTPEGLA